VCELAVVGVFDVDHSPSVLATSDRFALDDHIGLRADHSEGNDVLRHLSESAFKNATRHRTYSYGLVQLNLLLIVFVCVKRIHTNGVVH
jgi:hypothetical protein